MCQKNYMSAKRLNYNICGCVFGCCVNLIKLLKKQKPDQAFNTLTI